MPRAYVSISGFLNSLSRRVSQPTVEGRGAGGSQRCVESNASQIRQSAKVLLPVNMNHFIQQPSPEETLDNWVKERSDETATRQQIAKQIVILNGNPTVGGDLNLTGCTRITSLPEGLSVDRDLYLIGCTRLTSLPKNLSVDEDLFLIGCTRITSLPEGLSVGGYLDLIGCTGITSLPEGLRVRGDLDLDGCTHITSLPKWVFQLQQLQQNQTIHATNTGIPVQLLEQYNTRQNETDYLGPSIHFSIRDYQSISNFMAKQLPQLFQTITGTEANHPFWQYAAKQTDMGSLYNAFAEFLTRLLNELPAGDQRQKDLNELKNTLTPLFC